VNAAPKENALKTVKPTGCIHEAFSERDTRVELATFSLGIYNQPVIATTYKPIHSEAWRTCATSFRFLIGMVSLDGLVILGRSFFAY